MASPDGIGAYLKPNNGMGAYVKPAAPLPLPVPVQQQQQQHGGDMEGYQADWWEPADATEKSAVQSAGFTALLVSAGIGIGAALGGGWGAGAGGMLVASLFNGYRAQKWWDSGDASEKHEAVTSAVMTVANLGLGGYCAYKAYQGKK
jgi:hypothetical protein